MNQTLYTIFQQLAEQDDTELIALFQPRQRVERPSFNSGFRSMMQMNATTTRDEAKRKIREFGQLARNANQDGVAKAIEAARLFTPETVGQLLSLLCKKVTDEDLCKALLDDNGYPNTTLAIQSLFNGAPQYMLVVEDARPSESENTPPENALPDGRYDIYLQHMASGNRVLLHFSHHDAKVLFLWFAMHAGQTMKKPTIGRDTETIKAVARRCYYGVNAEKTLAKLNSAKGFEDFFTRAKKDANSYVENQLEGRDDAAWYSIQYDSRSGSFSFGLHPDYITLPESLNTLTKD